MSIAENFQKIGLCKYEALALEAVLKGESTAEAIANKSGVPISKIYFTLKALQDKGIVKSSLGRPRKYEAAEPEQLIELLKKPHEERIKEIRKIAKQTLKQISGMGYESSKLS